MTFSASVYSDYMPPVRWSETVLCLPTPQGKNMGISLKCLSQQMVADEYLSIRYVLRPLTTRALKLPTGDYLDEYSQCAIGLYYKVRYEPKGRGPNADDVGNDSVSW
jgi:hypothetical protein